MGSKKAEYWTTVLKIASVLNLPNVEETTSYKQPCLKAHKKLWVWCSPHEDAFVFKVPMEEREVLLSADPDTYFMTDHYRGYEMILVRPDKVDRNWASANLKRVWREQAGKRYLKKFDEDNA